MTVNNDGKQPWDFRGWATKFNTLVSDGVTIDPSAFTEDDGKTVPIVWNHQRNEPSNILGHVLLQHRAEGVYVFGYFNDSENAKIVKAQLEHGDISSMSIGANRIRKRGDNVVGGHIFETSLVVSGANPGALIDEVVTHGDGEMEAIIYGGTLIHSALDELNLSEEDNMTKTEELNHADDPQGGDVDVEAALASMTPEQREAVDLIVEAVSSAEENDDEGQEEDKDNMVQHNAFSDANNAGKSDAVLEHAALNELIIGAASEEAPSLKKYILEHADAEILEHADYANKGVTNIEALFPEAKNLTTPPTKIEDPYTGTAQIMAAVSKSPFSRVKAMYTDLTTDAFRAMGYIKGDQKVDDVITVAQRETTPQTVYVRNKMDRDDIIDITDFDITTWMQGILRGKLNDEIARAILVGDGRAASDRHKIKEDKIRPIWSDDDLYTIKKTTADLASFILDVSLALSELRGSGAPTMYIHPTTLARMRMLRDSIGRFLFGTVPTVSTMTAIIGVSSIQPTTFLKEGQVIFANLSDYTLGSSKGGEVTTFNDFDIDFNQLTFLIETRLSGALVNPKTALAFTITDPTTDVKYVTEVNDNSTTTPAAG